MSEVPKVEVAGEELRTECWQRGVPLTYNSCYWKMMWRVYHFLISSVVVGGQKQSHHVCVCICVYFICLFVRMKTYVSMYGALPCLCLISCGA